MRGKSFFGNSVKKTSRLFNKPTKQSSEYHTKSSKYGLLGQGHLSTAKKNKPIVVFGGASADMSTIAFLSRAKKEFLKTPIIKIHTPSYPVTADPSILAIPSEWGQPDSVMPMSRKIISHTFHRKYGIFNPKIKKVEPTSENIRVFLDTLKEEGLDGIERLGFYPTHFDLKRYSVPESPYHSHLEEAIMRVVTLQLCKQSHVYESIEEVDDNVHSVDLENGVLTLQNGKTIDTGLQDIDTVFDLSSELTKFPAFSSKIPTKDMIHLTKMSPEKYAGKAIVTIGSGQSVSWEVLYFLLKNPNPPSQIVIGLPPKGIPGGIDNAEEFMRKFQEEKDPYKKLNMIFGGQVIEKNLKDLIKSGVMDAIEQNKLVIFAQDRPDICTVSESGGTVTYSGINLLTGDKIPSTSTDVPVIACTGVYRNSRIEFHNHPDNGMTLRVRPSTEWFAPANMPSGSMVNLYHRFLKCMPGLSFEEVMGLPLNRFTDVCKCQYQETFANHGLDIPIEFFNELGVELSKIKTDTVKDEEAYDAILKRLMDKYIPGQEEEFMRIFAEINFERAEKLQEYIESLFSDVEGVGPMDEEEMSERLGIGTTTPERQEHMSGEQELMVLNILASLKRGVKEEARLQFTMDDPRHMKL